MIRTYSRARARGLKKGNMSSEDDIREVYETDIARKCRVVCSGRDGIMAFYGGVDDMRVDVVVPETTELARIGEAARIAELDE